MRAKSIALLTLIFFLFQVAQISAQEIYQPSQKHIRNAHALEKWKELNDGILVFVLVTNEKKLQYLEEILASDKLTNSQRKYYNVEKDVAQTEVKKYDQELKSALATHYDFSNYAFVKDVDMRNYLENPMNLKIYDALGKVIPLDPKQKLFFFRSSNAGIGNYVIFNDELNSIAKPFPGSYRKTIFTSVRSFSSVIEQMNSRLYKFSRKKIMYSEQ